MSVPNLHSVTAESVELELQPFKELRFERSANKLEVQLLAVDHLGRKTWIARLSPAKLRELIDAAAATELDLERAG